MNNEDILKSAENGDKQAIIAVCDLIDGSGQSPLYAQLQRVVPILIAGASKGEPEAWTKLGTLAWSGRGLKEDLVLGLVCWKAAYEIIEMHARTNPDYPFAPESPRLARARAEAAIKIKDGQRYLRANATATDAYDGMPFDKILEAVRTNATV